MIRSRSRCSKCNFLSSCRSELLSGCCCCGLSRECAIAAGVWDDRDLGTDAMERPASGDVRPALGDVRPASGDVRPASEDVRPASGDVRPASGDVRPASGDVRPASEDVRPASGDDRDSAKQNGVRVSSSSSVSVFRASFRQNSRKLSKFEGISSLRHVTAPCLIFSLYFLLSFSFKLTKSHESVPVYLFNSILLGFFVE